eukprot:ANDGO_00261.mRNA.1 hypothetical protein
MSLFSTKRVTIADVVRAAQFPPYFREYDSSFEIAGSLTLDCSDSIYAFGFIVFLEDGNARIPMICAKIMSVDESVLLASQNDVGPGSVNNQMNRPSHFRPGSGVIVRGPFSVVGVDPCFRRDAAQRQAIIHLEVSVEKITPEVIPRRNALQFASSAPTMTRKAFRGLLCAVSSIVQGSNEKSGFFADLLCVPVDRPSESFRVFLVLSHSNALVCHAMGQLRPHLWISLSHVRPVEMQGWKLFEDTSETVVDSYVPSPTERHTLTSKMEDMLHSEWNASSRYLTYEGAITSIVQRRGEIVLDGKVRFFPCYSSWSTYGLAFRPGTSVEIHNALLVHIPSSRHAGRAESHFAKSDLSSEVVCVATLRTTVQVSGFGLLSGIPHVPLPLVLAHSDVVKLSRRWSAPSLLFWFSLIDDLIALRRPFKTVKEILVVDIISRVHTYAADVCGWGIQQLKTRSVMEEFFSPGQENLPIRAPLLISEASNTNCSFLVGRVVIDSAGSLTLVSAQLNQDAVYLLPFDREIARAAESESCPTRDLVVIIPQFTIEPISSQSWRFASQTNVYVVRLLRDPCFFAFQNGELKLYPLQCNVDIRGPNSKLQNRFERLRSLQLVSRVAPRSSPQGGLAVVFSDVRTRKVCSRYVSADRFVDVIPGTVVEFREEAGIVTAIPVGIDNLEPEEKAALRQNCASTLQVLEKRSVRSLLLHGFPSTSDIICVEGFIVSMEKRMDDNAKLFLVIRGTDTPDTVSCYVAPSSCFFIEPLFAGMLVLLQYFKRKVSPKTGHVYLASEPESCLVVESAASPPLEEWKKVPSSTLHDLVVSPDLLPCLHAITGNLISLSRLEILAKCGQCGSVVGGGSRQKCAKGCSSVAGEVFSMSLLGTVDDSTGRAKVRAFDTVVRGLLGWDDQKWECICDIMRKIGAFTYLPRGNEKLGSKFVLDSFSDQELLLYEMIKSSECSWSDPSALSRHHSKTLSADKIFYVQPYYKDGRGVASEQEVYIGSMRKPRMLVLPYINLQILAFENVARPNRRLERARFLLESMKTLDSSSMFDAI